MHQREPSFACSCSFPCPAAAECHDPEAAEGVDAGTMGCSGGASKYCRHVVLVVVVVQLVSLLASRFFMGSLSLLLGYDSFHPATAIYARTSRATSSSSNASLCAFAAQCNTAGYCGRKSTPARTRWMNDNRVKKA